METELKVSFTTPKAFRDYGLVRQAIESGNQRAYAQLLDNYRESLYMLMLKMVNDPHDAEDLTIEAFGKAFRNLSKYTADYAFSTWLFKIAANNCLNFMRKKNVNLFRIDRDYVSSVDSKYYFELDDKEPNPEERLFDKEKISQIREIVNTLKPRYRTMIELRYFEELSYEEIAKELNVPIGTVKAMLYRAKSMLQAIIKKEEI